MRGPFCVALMVLGFGAACSAPTAAPPRPVSSDLASRDLLSDAELETLRAGGNVARPLTFEKEGGRYVGGVAYQVVQAPPDAVLRALREPDRLADLLPRTRSVKEVEGEDSLTRFELTQGNDMMSASYTIVLEEPPGSREIRFWLDPTRHHDIDDVWGYFRVQAFEGTGASLVTVGVALDVGNGIVRMLFERQIQQVILATPSHMRKVLEQGRATGEVARVER